MADAILQAPALELQDRDLLAEKLRHRDRGGHCSRGVAIAVPLRRSAQVSLVGAECERHQVRPFGEKAMDAVGDARSSFVEDVVDNDDPALGQGALGRREIVNGMLWRVAAVDADQAQRPLGQPHEIGGGQVE